MAMTMHILKPVEQPKQHPRAVDLPNYVRAAIAGTNAECRAHAATSGTEAAQIVTAALVQRFGRDLDPVEQSRVDVETIAQWNAQMEAKRAGLRDTQQRLHDPLFGFRR